MRIKKFKNIMPISVIRKSPSLISAPSSSVKANINNASNESVEKRMNCSPSTMPILSFITSPQVRTLSLGSRGGIKYVNNQLTNKNSVTYMVVSGLESPLP